MPFCKYCHGEISRFDEDVCPHCGAPSPIDEGYKTMDVTKTIHDLNLPKDLYRSRSRIVYALLCCLLGVFGVHSFYARYYKRGGIELGGTIVLVAGIGSLLYFTAFPSVWAYLIPLICLYAIAIGFGIFYFLYDSVKDGKGELLR